MATPDTLDRHTLVLALGALSLLALCAAIWTIVHFARLQRRFNADAEARRQESLLRQGQLTAEGAAEGGVHVRLTAVRLEWWRGDAAGPAGGRNGSACMSVLLDDVADAEVGARHRVVVRVMQPVQRSTLGAFLDACVPGRRHWARRIATSVNFVAPNAEEAAAWAGAVRGAIGSADSAAAVAPKRVLLVVNPMAGTRQAKFALARLIAALGPRCAVSTESPLPVAQRKEEARQPGASSASRVRRLEVVVRMTERIGHGREIAMAAPLAGAAGGFDGIVCVGGDGILHEVVNGVLSRPDGAAAAASLAFGIVPVGSGNGIAKSHGVMPLDVETVALRLLQWRVQPLDIVEVNCTAPNGEHVATLPSPLYSLVSASYGIISDVDRESERFRWMGSLRFTAVALLKIIELPTVRARVSHGGNAPLDETNWLGIGVLNLPWITHDLK
jgi:diacylglycerol kinase family enzyme